MTQNEMPDLLPCPCCGNKNNCISDYTDDYHIRKGYQYDITCKGDFGIPRHEFSAYGATKQEVTIAWNTRAAPKLPDTDKVTS